MHGFYLLIVIEVAVFAIITTLIWLFYGNGIDKLRHPKEWSDAGKAGEQATYLALTNKYHVPPEQIIRNVYISTAKGDTAEIDLIVLSRKGILVFECKNYHGNIYGDGRRRRWVQYLGRQKNYFYSPVMQNRTHAQAVRNYFSDIPGLPVIPIFVATNNATLKLRNINPDDHVMGDNLSLSDVYDQLPDSDVMASHYGRILRTLRQFERPDDTIRQQHIDQIKNRH